MKWFKKILGTRLAGITCFLFAIANRIIFTTLNSLIGTDTKIQLTYTENLLAQKGMGVTKYFTNDLYTPFFDTQQIFPPGLSLTIIPFLKIFGGDEHKAIMTFDILVSILFVVAIRILGKKAGLPGWINNIVTLMAGCIQYIFFSSWSSTDAISLCFVLFSLALTIDIINKKENVGLLKTIGCGFLFSLPFFFRYMYLPIAILLPSLIILSGLLQKNKKVRVAGLKILGVSVLFLVVLILFSLSTSGNALFVYDFGRGVFIKQLSKWYPFLPASFINLDFAAQLSERISGLPYSRFMLFMEILNPLLLVLLIILLSRYLSNHRKDQTYSTHFLFIVIGSFISITILVLLAYLTLTYKAIDWGLLKWTHSQHARYFAFLYAFIPILFFVIMFHYGHVVKRSFIRYFAFIAFVCLVIESLHGVYYNTKILLAHNDLSIIRDADNGYRNFPTILKELKKQNADREILVSSPDHFYLHAASQMGYKAIFDHQNLSRTDLRVNSKSILLMPVHEQEAIIMKEYIEKKKPKLLSIISGTYFYLEEINPQ
jgi:hypothetical protein